MLHVWQHVSRLLFTPHLIVVPAFLSFLLFLRTDVIFLDICARSSFWLHFLNQTSPKPPVMCLFLSCSTFFQNAGAEVSSCLCLSVCVWQLLVLSHVILEGSLHAPCAVCHRFHEENLRQACRAEQGGGEVTTETNGEDDMRRWWWRALIRHGGTLAHSDNVSPLG